MGGYGGGDPLVPIPNTTVKPSRAPTTSRVTARESESPPATLKPFSITEKGFFFASWSHQKHFPPFSSYSAMTTH